MTAITGYPASRQQHHVWKESAMRDRPHWNACLVELPDEIDASKLEQAVFAVLDRYEVLRTSIVPGPNGELLQVIDDPCNRLTFAESPPPDRVAAATTPPDAVVFTATVHQRSRMLLQAPAWAADRHSLAVIAAEIANIYHASAVVEFEALQYRQYALWQQEEDPGNARLQRHGGLPFMTMAAAPSLVIRCLNATERSYFLDLGMRWGTSLDDTIAACWAAVARCHQPDEPVNMAVLGSGRNLPDLDNAVGPFERWTGVVQIHPHATDEIASAIRQRVVGENLVPDIGWVGADPDLESLFPVGWITGSADSDHVVAGYQLHGRKAITSIWLSGPDQRAIEVLAGQVISAARELATGQARSAPRLLTSAKGHATALTQPGPTKPADIVSRFLTIADKNPDAVAVRHDGHEFTYSTLAARSADIAAKLAGLGMPRETVVALRTQPGLDLLASMLGVWRAGLSVCPLDIDWPKHRVDNLVRLAHAGAVIISNSLDAIDHGVRTIVVDDIQESLQRTDPSASIHDLQQILDLHPLSQAYVMFTSGSTGDPKGVSVTHGALASYLDWVANSYPVAAGRGSLVHTSVGFDLTLTGLLGPIVVGGVVNLATTLDFEGLIRSLNSEQGFGLVKLTPSHLRLLGELRPGDAASEITQCLIVGGEQLTEQTMQYWRRHAGETRFINEYGPTETTVGITAYDATVPNARSAVPIGTAITGASVHVLDDDGGSVGTGLVGEIYLGGPQVARGYLDDPRLTAERFVPSPDPDAPGERLYRTGDLARVVPTGDLEYVGRTDEQIQLNGVRIEPTEVEATLAGIPGVAAGAVRCSHDGRRDVLEAFVVIDDERLTVDSVHAQVRRLLPGYSVPDTIVQLFELPLTVNGKIDRSALPAATPKNTSDGSTPSGDVENKVKSVWCDVLGLETIGNHDSFFDMGGDSFLLIDLAARLQVHVRSDITPLTIFENPTVAELVAALTRAPADNMVTDDDEQRRVRTTARREAIERRRAQRRRDPEVTP